MADTVTARAGDTLDELVWRTCALGPADLPGVIALNPGIANAGPVLPAGTIVTVPPAPTAPATPTRDLIQLWD
ncbi:tail protein X [Sphingomonas sp. 8AM]|uniref:tail protein X n=1 Tax=Sphingomonas sp. 8AM TaxID=2653170 RepID=UPI0012F05D81|nr:tail protein X [Sphingomonas sp. 8AM]VXC90779.1 Phage tail protein [Sphingomonas sp. 8AM]